MDDHAASAVPLPPATFYILFALATGEKHGYAIMREARELSDHQFQLGPATLYTTIQRLLEANWIVEARGDADGDSRRPLLRPHPPRKIRAQTGDATHGSPGQKVASSRPPPVGVQIMTRVLPPILRWSSRVYAVLLRLYPAELRHEFSGEIAFVFAEDLEAASRERGFAGVARTWSCALGEFLRIALTGYRTNPVIMVPILSFASSVLTLGAEMMIVFWLHPGRIHAQHCPA